MKKTILITCLGIALAAFVYLVVVPAFAGNLLLSPTFQIGSFAIRWYGLTMALSVLAGYFICRKYSWRFGIDQAEVENFAFYLVIVAFLGARLYFIIFDWSYFSENLSEVYKVWHGGISIYGALISGLMFTYFWSRNKAYGFKHLVDLVALGLPLAQAIGRWGNFFNQEAFGYPTNLPWKMFVPPGARPEVYADAQFFHPTFLYESLLMAIVFFVLLRLLGKVKPGVLGFAYLGLYSLVRFFIEPFRLDSVWIGGFRADQAVAMVMFMLSGIIIIAWQFWREPNPPAINH